MQVTGSVKKVDYIKVDIIPKDMLDAMENQWMRDIGMFMGDWINSDGKWETDIHLPSRLTQVGRDATDEEKAIVQSFKTLRTIKFSK